MAIVQGNIGHSRGCSDSQISQITSKDGDGFEGCGERFQEFVTEPGSKQCGCCQSQEFRQ